MVTLASSAVPVPEPGRPSWAGTIKRETQSAKRKFALESEVGNFLAMEAKTGAGYLFALDDHLICHILTFLNGWTVSIASQTSKR